MLEGRTVCLTGFAVVHLYAALLIPSSFERPFRKYFEGLNSSHQVQFSLKKRSSICCIIFWQTEFWSMTYWDDWHANETKKKKSVSVQSFFMIKFLNWLNPAQSYIQMYIYIYHTYIFIYFLYLYIIHTIYVWSKQRCSLEQNCVICKLDRSGPAAFKIPYEQFIPVS